MAPTMSWLVAITITILVSHSLPHSTESAFTLSTSMFTQPSYESDFLYLRYHPFTGNPMDAPGASYGGVYATHSFAFNDIICQMRGHLIPSQNISSFNIESIMTYNVEAPSSVKKSNNNEEEEVVPGDRYVLVENTICSRIRFCFPEPSSAIGSCGNAVLIPRLGSLKVFAARNISILEEIVLEIHERSIFNLASTHFNEFCQFDAHGCESVISHTLPSQSGVISSEDLLFYTAPSSVPGAGLGLFAKYDFPAYQLLILCQGRVYENSPYLMAVATKPERLTSSRLVNGVEKVIQMDNLCGNANDIIDISFLKTNYSYSDYCPTQGVRSIPVLDESKYRYNAGQGGMLQSSFLSSLGKPIAAGDEIFQHYGDTYWWYVYRKHHGLTC